MRSTLFLWLLILSTQLLPLSGQAKEIDQQDFINGIFTSNPEKIKLKKIWLTGTKKATVKSILGHPYHKLRVSYWIHPDYPNETIWILHEIGKEKMIDVGIAIKDQKIKKLRILKFRESRGWEVRLPFFTKQFDQNSLSTDYKLTKRVDSISGATLSYRAVTKLARMALFLDQQL